QKSRPQSVTVLSVGSAPLRIVVSPQGGVGAFRVKSACSGTIPPQGCTILVDVAAQKPADYDATLTVTSNAVNGMQTISLRAVIREQPKPPAMTVMPASISFGDVLVGSTGRQTLTINSTGGSPITIDSVAITKGARGFTVGSNCNNTTVSPQSTC